MKVLLLPYKAGSNGAKVLAANIGVRRIKLENSKFIPGNNKLVINWGNSRPGFAQGTWLNEPSCVKLASNKLYSLEVMSVEGVPCVEFTTSRSKANEWRISDTMVVARNKLTGHSGEGIEIITTEEQVVDSPARLYTRYFKAKDEYRVHVMGDKVIDVQQKRKRDDVPKEEANYMIRSHDNGFNFCREDVDLPDVCVAAALAAIKALSLDFGAVDIRYNDKSKECAVLEVNTAPGLEGTTIETYTKAFTELFQNFNVQ